MPMLSCRPTWSESRLGHLVMDLEYRWPFFSTMSLRRPNWHLDLAGRVLLRYVGKIAFVANNWGNATFGSIYLVYLLSSIRGYRPAEAYAKLYASMLLVLDGSSSAHRCKQPIVVVFYIG